MKVRLRKPRRIGLDNYDEVGKDYDVDPERAGKYAEYFQFLSAADEDLAHATYEARLARDAEARAARMTPAFTLTDIAEAVARLITTQAATAPAQKPTGGRT